MRERTLASEYRHRGASQRRTHGVHQRFGVLAVGTDAQRFWVSAAIPASAAALIYSYMLKGSITELLKTLLERRRLESLDLHGQNLHQSMSRSSGFPPVESLEPLSDGAKNTAGRIRRRLKVTVWTGTLSVVAFAFFYGVLLGGWALNLDVDTLLFNYLTPIGPVALLFDLLIAPRIIVTGFNQGPDDWAHPRPPSAAEQIRTEIETAQRSSSQRSIRGLRRLFHRGGDRATGLLRAPELVPQIRDMPPG